MIEYSFRNYHHGIQSFTFFLVLFVVMIDRPSFAAHDPVNKLKRGAVNVLTAPVEIPKEIRSYWIQGSEKTFHISAWIFCGLVKGVVNTPVRLVSGVWDVLTFPIATNKDNQPLYKPEYVFEEWPKRKPGVIYKNMGVE